MVVIIEDYTNVPGSVAYDSAGGCSVQTHQCNMLVALLSFVIFPSKPMQHMFSVFSHFSDNSIHLLLKI